MLLLYSIDLLKNTFNKTSSSIKQNEEYKIFYHCSNKPFRFEIQKWTFVCLSAPLSGILNFEIVQ